MMEELKKIPQIGKFLLRKEFDAINKTSLQKIINNFFSKLKDGAKKGLAINQSQDEMAKEVLEMLDNIAENSAHHGGRLRWYFANAVERIKHLTTHKDNLYANAD